MLFAKVKKHALEYMPLKLPGRGFGKSNYFNLTLL